MKIQGVHAHSAAAAVDARSTRERSVVSAKPGMRSTGLGLLMTGWGSAVVLTTVGVMVTLAFASPFAVENWFPYLGGGLLAGGLLAIVGVFVCGSVPRESGAKAWATASIVLCSLNVALAGYAIFCLLGRVAPFVSPAALQLTTSLIGTACFFAFVTFIKKVARYTSRPELATTAKVIVWIQVSVLVLSVGATAFSMTGQVGDSALMVLNAVAIVIAITSLINQIVLNVLEFQLGSHLRRG